MYCIILSPYLQPPGQQNAYVLEGSVDSPMIVVDKEIIEVTLYNASLDSMENVLYTDDCLVYLPVGPFFDVS